MTSHEFANQLPILEGRAQILFDNAVDEYTQSSNQRRAELKQIVEENLSTHEKMKDWGGLDIDCVIAGREFLSFIALLHNIH